MSAEDSVKEHFKSLATIAAVRQLSRLCYSRDGEVLLGAGRDGLIYRWRLPVGGYSSGDAAAAMEQPSVSGHSGWVAALDVSSDGSYLLSADSWGRLICRSMESVDLPVLWNHGEAHAGWIRHAIFHSAGNQIISCGLDGMVRVARICIRWHVIRTVKRLWWGI
jgi:WD40 repeat protein